MQKEFNDTGTCVPEMHYMVDISAKLAEILELIENRKYFTINRPRQYGKSTTLFMLEKELVKKDYLVISISFEGVGDSIFQEESLFCKKFLEILAKGIFPANKLLSNFLLEKAPDVEIIMDLSGVLSQFIVESNKKVVLLVDEVDKNSNNQLFLNFLGMLRDKYLKRNTGRDYTFHSVVLVGVHDVKNLKLKIRHDGEKEYNSPWNIAVKFEVEMSFSPEEIKTMLEDYIIHRNMQMDVECIAKKLFYYTSGYPFLVSRLCKIIDEKIIQEKLLKEWEAQDIDFAVKLLLQEKNTNSESLTKNLENNVELYQVVYDLIMEGREITYNAHNPIVEQGTIYGIFKNSGGKVKIHNRIYEQWIYDYMSSKLETSTRINEYNYSGQFIEKDGTINFEKVLVKFQAFLHEQYSQKDEEFLERNGRLLFLAFIKPVINGKGFDFKEVQISEEKRLDIVITYLNHRYVVELKVWRGEKAHEAGLAQLADYCDRMSVDKGYLIIYDFRKKKQWEQERIKVGKWQIFVVWV